MRSVPDDAEILMDIKEIVRQELELAAKAVQLAASRLDSSIEKAVDLLYNCSGKVIVTGMGKTGIIARKIAATLSSTGTTAIFLHTAEGIHGDLGTTKIWWLLSPTVEILKSCFPLFPLLNSTRSRLLP